MTTANHPPRTSPVTAVQYSVDPKFGPPKKCSATWVAQGSCPTDCPFYKAGCYAENGRAGMVTKTLNAVGKFSAKQLAILEAAAIDGLKPKFDLRLHVVGDCKTNQAAQIVSKAASAYQSRTDGKSVWTYTHAWKVVRRKNWRDVSVLASCQNVGEVEEAMESGYGCAMVVSEFESEKAYKISADLTGIPCPKQTERSTGCVQCRLCMKDKYLRDKNMVILFAAHGNGAKKVQAALTVRNAPAALVA